MGMISAAHGRMKMVLVPGGCFTMGSREQAPDTADEQPPHPVQVDSFYMAVYPVTQAVYRALMGPELITYACDGHNQAPYYCASWFDAVEFCNRLSELDGLEPVYTLAEQTVVCRWQANGYRLPTEAEWEWCWDWYDAGYYARATGVNPKGPKNGIRRVGRGGAWAWGHREARINNREDFNPTWGGNYMGIRFVRNAIPPIPIE